MSSIAHPTTIVLICPQCGHRIVRDRDSGELVFGTLLHKGKARSGYAHHCTGCGDSITAGTWMKIDV